MKKLYLLSFCLIFLSSCTQLNKDATLFGMFNSGSFSFFNKGKKVPVVEQVGAEEEQININYIALNKNPQEELSEGEEIVAGYNLAKRGERYDEAQYNIDPQVYGIVASRAVNKMLTEVPAIFADNKNASVFIEKTILVDRYMPTLPESAEKAAKEIISGSKMFVVAETPEDAQYTLKSTLNNANTPELPVFIYDLKLYDKSGKLLGAWSDNIRQIQNDDESWW